MMRMRMMMIIMSTLLFSGNKINKVCQQNEGASTAGTVGPIGTVGRHLSDELA